MRTFLGQPLPSINAKLDQALRSLHHELFLEARKGTVLADEYVADLIQRALANQRWTYGDTLSHPWRHETI